MPPYEDAAPPVARSNAQLYEPERSLPAFREVRMPREESSQDRLVRDGYDVRRNTVNDHRAGARFEDPRQLAYGALQTENQFGFAFARPKYLAAITAADRIAQRTVYQDRCAICSRMQCVDLTLARGADGCCRNSRVTRMNPCAENNLRSQRQGCVQEEDRLWGCYLSPGTTRIQAGLRFIANGERQEGEKLIARGLQLRPEIHSDPRFQKMLQDARAQGEHRPTTPPAPPPRVEPSDFYNYSGQVPAPGAPFAPRPPLERSSNLPRSPIVDRAAPGWRPPDVRPTEVRPTEVRPVVAPQPDVRTNPVVRTAASEVARVFPYSRDELTRRETATMDYVAKMAPGYRFSPPASAFRIAGAQPPARTFPPIESPPVRPGPPVVVDRPLPPGTNPADPFRRPEEPVGRQNFIDTVKEYAKKDWVQGLAVILAGLGAIKGYQIYQRLGQDVVTQHVENPEQTKVTVDATKPTTERGVRAFDRTTGDPLTRRSPDGKFWEVDKPGGIVEKIPVQDIDRVRYEIVAANEREVKEFKAQLELDLKGLHDRAGWVPKLDVQQDAAMTEARKFVLTEKGVEVGRIEAINADGTVKVKLADGTSVNKTVGPDTALVLKVKDGVAAQQKLAGMDIAEFMKLASPTVTLRDWTRLQGDVHEKNNKEFEDKLTQSLEESKKAHDQTKQKLEEARKQLADQDKLNETERKKYTAEIDALQKQLEKATEAVVKAEERVKAEATQREAAVKQFQETRAKLETAQKDLVLLGDTDATKKAELEKKIAELNGDLTKNSKALDDVNKKLVQQIDETTKARERAGELEKNLEAVQAKLLTEQQRAQQLEKGLADRDAEVKALTEAKRLSEERALESEKQRVAREAEVAQAKAELDAAKKALEGKTGTDVALKEATDKLAQLQEKYDASVKAQTEFQKQLLAEQKARTAIGEELIKVQEQLAKAQTDVTQLKTKTEAEQKALEKVEADLQKKVADLTKQLTESDARAQAQDAEQKRLSGELSRAQGELKDATVKLGGEAAKIADLQKQLGEREAELKQAQEAKRLADERAAEAEKQRAARDTELAQIKTELDAAKKEIDKKLGTDAALADANTKLTELQTKYDAAVKARDEFQQRLKTEETARTTQTEAVQKLQDQLAKAQADLKDIGTKTADEKLALETTAKTLQTQLQEATAKLQKSEANVKDAQLEQQRIGVELQQARTALADATTKISGDAVTIASLQKQLDAAKEAERTAGERAVEAEKQRAARDAELERVRGELEKAKGELGKLTGTDAALKEANAKLAKLQTEFEEATKARDEFQQRLKTEETERGKVTETVRQLQEQLTKTQTELKDLGTKTAGEKLALETAARTLQEQLREATAKLTESEARTKTAQQEQQRVGVELEQARTALSDATAKIAELSRPATGGSGTGGGLRVPGKPLTSGGDNYRPIAREGDVVTLLNIDKVPDGREQNRSKAELSNMYDRKMLNLDGTPREFLVEKSKGDGRPQRVYQLVTDATDTSSGKIKLVGETYVKNVTDKAGNSGQTYQQWLEDYDARKGTTEVVERMRPGMEGNVGGTPTGTASTDVPVRPVDAPPVAPPVDAAAAAQADALREVNNRLTNAPGESASADVRAAIDDAIAQQEGDPAKKAVVEELTKLKTRYATEARAINESIAKARATVATPGGPAVVGGAEPLPSLGYDRTNVAGGNVTGDPHTTGATGDRTGEKLTQEDVKELETQKVANQTRLKQIETELAKTDLEAAKRTQLETEQKRLMAENTNIERAKTDPVFAGRLKSLARIAGPVGAVGILIITLRSMAGDTRAPSTIPHQRWSQPGA